MRILGADGAFAEYLAVPLTNLHVVPDSVPDEMAVSQNRWRRPSPSSNR